jgi:hypothetical protein
MIWKILVFLGRESLSAQNPYRDAAVKESTVMLQHHIREYWMIFRGPGFFLADLWIGSSPTLYVAPPPVSSAGTQEDWDRVTTESDIFS